MKETRNTPHIEKRENAIKIGNAVLDREALEVIEDIQDTLGDHYRTGLGRIQELLLDSCEDLPVEYDEAIHLLQMLSNLKRDIGTLMWAVNPLPPDSGYRRRNCPEDEYLTAIEAMELADANDDPDNDGTEHGSREN